MLADRWGWRYYALVIACHNRELEVEPVDRPVVAPCADRRQPPVALPAVRSGAASFMTVTGWAPQESRVTVVLVVSVGTIPAPIR